MEKGKDNHKIRILFAMIYEKRYIISIIILLFVVVAYVLFKILCVDRPEVAFFRGTRETPDLKIPERPGTQGIIISGPPRRTKKFEINTGAAGIRPINWSTLREIDATAQIRVRTYIDDTGNLNIYDLRDAGFPAAGDYIEQIMNTWAFTRYKTGDMEFFFNVGSIGAELTIDLRGLERNAGLPKNLPIDNGLLHYIINGNISVGYIDQ